MRFDPLLGQDVEEEVERLFYTAAPARFVHIQGGFFDCSALKMTKCQTHWKI